MTNDHFRLLRVLVAEDDEFQRRFIVGLLKDLGVVSVHEATHGVEVLNRLKELGSSAIDLLICDLELPGLDGFDLLDRFRRSRDVALHRLPVIIVSVHRHVDTVDRAVAIGATGFLAKPITPDGLRRFLENLVTETAQPSPTNQVSSPV